MIKRINWKAIFTGFAWALSLTGLVLLMSFIEAEKSSQKCVGVKVFIPGYQNFVSRQEVDRLLLNAGGKLVGQELNSINTQLLEDGLESNPFIEAAKVYADMNGTVWVRIKQREPVLRIFNVKNQDFYIDQHGLKIPVSPNFTAQVLVATGNITEDLGGRVGGLKTALAKDLFKLALFISKDTLWSDQIEQIYVNANSEIQLVPRIGDHQIILGTADSLESKFQNLLIFYKEAMPKIGWNTYKTLNLKYANQVICKRSGIALDTLAAPKALADSTQKSVPDTLKN